MSKNALIVVDVQKDFCEGGSLAVTGGNEVAEKIAAFIRGDATDEWNYDYVVATKDWHIDPNGHFSETPDFVDSWPVHCDADTEGADFNPAIDPDYFAAVFYKGEYAAAYSGFEGLAESGETLTDWLRAREVEAVDVVGIATDYCVKATAIDAAKNGFHTQVLLPFCRPVSPEGEEQAVEEMVKAGVVVE